MGTQNENVPELQKVNRTCISCYVTLMLMITGFTIAQVMLSDTPLSRFYLLYAVMGVTVSISLFTYYTNTGSPLVKHVIATSSGISYFILLLTSHSLLAFTYAIPMLIITTAFGNVIFSSIISGFVMLINVIACVIDIVSRDLSNDDILNMIIRLLFILFVTVNVILVTRLIVQLNKEKTDRMQKEQDKVSDLLSHILTISNGMISDINDISTNMVSFKESVSETQSAMEEVSQGTNDTAESIQLQLTKTEEIQRQIQNVTNASKNIEIDSISAKDSISNGESNINELIHQVTISETASTTVADELTALDDSTEKMHSIIEVINNVARQTSLLSLNASIEAARAGEAGRGFAVVAGEISTLAKQTQDATNNISTLIQNVSDVASTVIDSIQNLIESNAAQGQAATKSAHSFTEIKERTTDIYSRTKDLIESVSALSDSNREIIDSISTISAITEEVSAHSNATYSSGEKNSETMGSLSNLINSLSQKAKILQNTER